METPLRVFVGSSSEGKRLAEITATLLCEVGGESIRIRAWWHQGSDSVFQPGTTFIDSLAAIMDETDAAILIVTPDDETSHRGNQIFAARDNVILECGMSISAHTLKCTALAVFGDAKLPSDLDGVNHVKLKGNPEQSDFKERNKDAILGLLSGWRSRKKEREREVKVVLPKLYEVILKVLATFKESPKTQGLDLLAAALLDSIAEQFSDRRIHSGITQQICMLLENHLKTADAIHALDVLGPSAWFTPTAFRYLAIQIRRYFRSNNIKGDEPFPLSRNVVSAIRRATANALSRGQRGSASKFDAQNCSTPESAVQSDFQWVERAPDQPGLEFTRVLLWTEEEFRNPIAESVINIHEAFHVPLFALLVRSESKVREFDFIAFRQRNDTVQGFYNRRRDGFKPDVIQNSRVPGHGSCLSHWNAIFEHSQLMFAADIHQLIDAGGTIEPMA